MNKAPDDLGVAGVRLWEDMHAQIAKTSAAFDEKDMTLLTLACRQMDDIAQLQAALTSDGVISIGSQGQPVMSKLVTELRNQRESVARLLKQVDWPNDKLSQPELARRAARARWSSRPAPNNRVLPEAK